MTVSAAQEKVLNRMANGGVYSLELVGEGDREWGHWLDYRPGERTYVRSIHILEGLGMIECHKETYLFKLYHITDAGRETLKEANK